MTITMADSQDAGIRPVQFLWLEITGKCQLECGHCYADSGPAGTHGRMRLPDWLRVIDEAARLGVRTVQFIGGEPTLHPDLPDLIPAAKRAGLAIEVFSNLVHITDELWDTFLRCDVGRRPPTTVTIPASTAPSPAGRRIPARAPTS
ncbi:radical SAM protein [Amycolatopsis acidicola]|uniref:radical SAM protein n=1 Tax=Amycolatopsis acidicola TaxID=2596893 RepID=UPI001FB59E94|nr:radical SAM protein [Amycolatopsis acidicola]